ncbi:efflux pump [Methanobrevibacter arboriphilus JCM 13429 = DSM 1125]|uniref:Efflux pump n=1 Tax=Methanobrevibacter arboriphilus JCM 13429 = DSM 1125 TaxID=1300164 RepID=A0A1V6N3D6_METAZ|nr:bile acid:sodium symporter [Methanobrevibacter arboriphilus]OQD59195.1 efflux pump [Methanobrevibacter arboriphilus JCM 13429 = DSM 1125]
MNVLEKFQSIIILVAIIFGLVFGQLTIINNSAGYFIIPFLFLMLFGIFGSISLKDFKKSFSNFKFAKVTILMNFIWTPLFAYILGAIFLNQHIDIWIGFIMLMVTPCTDWYLIFTDIAKGNLPLSTSILPLNLILQLILLPIYLLLFFGVFGSFDYGILLESILLMVFLPFILAQIARYLFTNMKSLNSFKDNFFSFFESSQIIFLSLAIFCMFASNGYLLVNNLWVILLLLIPMFLFFILNFFIGRLLTNKLNFCYADSVSLSMTTLARNSPIALAIAVIAFPNQPLVALALVIGPLIELPVLAIISQVLLFIKRKNFL